MQYSLPSAAGQVPLLVHLLPRLLILLTAQLLHAQQEVQLGQLAALQKLPEPGTEGSSISRSCQLT